MQGKLLLFVLMIELSISDLTVVLEKKNQKQSKPIFSLNTRALRVTGEITMHALFNF